jgi:hypothetical protein
MERWEARKKGVQRVRRNYDGILLVSTGPIGLEEMERNLKSKYQGLERI